MRVVEESASSTSCAIMSEEKSSNGTESDGSNSKKSQRTEQNHSPSSEYHSEQGYALPGGRLKFFKEQQGKNTSYCCDEDISSVLLSAR
ncbi:hypothetical protein RUM43_007969 [Polyplax serrata]|uniref:Uncharacterized protein n=1 Tax=Polyplax serrata TaxID=468196 RepID=A0AAN8S8V2_POLSC